MLRGLFGASEDVSLWAGEIVLSESVIQASEGEDSTLEREKAAASGKSRKSYAITARGKQRFYALMEERSEYYAKYRELFIIKLNNFDYLSAQQQLSILWQYRSFLQTEDLYLSGAQQEVLTDPHILDQHRAHILHIIRFRQSSIRGEMHWIEEQIKRLEEETEDVL